MTRAERQPVTQPALDPNQIVVKDTCKDCGDAFTMTRSHVEFFTERQLQVPKRCEDCLNQRRLQRETQEHGTV